MTELILLNRTEHDCEVFCHDCGQLRLWLKGVKVEACGNCGSKHIETDTLNSARLSALRDNYSKE